MQGRKLWMWGLKPFFPSHVPVPFSGRVGQSPAAIGVPLDLWVGPQACVVATETDLWKINTFGQAARLRTHRGDAIPGARVHSVQLTTDRAIVVLKEDREANNGAGSMAFHALRPLLRPRPQDPRKTDDMLRATYKLPSLPAGEVFTHAACCDQFDLVATNRNSLYVCDVFDDQHPSKGSAGHWRPVPVPSSGQVRHILSTSRLQSVASGWGHMLLHFVGQGGAGQCLALGSNRHGQCAVGAATPPEAASKLACFAGRADDPLNGNVGLAPVRFAEGLQLQPDLVKVAVGSSHSLALDRHGRVYFAGSHKDGKGGRQFAEADVPVFTRMAGLPEPIVDVVCGNDHSFVQAQTGSLLGWGFKQHGSVGVSEPLSLEKRLDIERVLLPSAGHRIVKVGASFDFSCAIVEEPA